MTFHGAVETAISRLLYRTTDTSRCQRTVGIGTPLHWWTHRALSDERAVATEADYVWFVLRHCGHVNVPMGEIIVVCGSAAVEAAIRARVSEGGKGGALPSSASPDDLRILALSSCPGLAAAASEAPPHSPRTTNGVPGQPPRVFPAGKNDPNPIARVVLFALGGFPSATLADQLKGPSVAAACGFARESLIFVGHIAWSTFMAPHHPIAKAVRKLAMESWQHPLANVKERGGVENEDGDGGNRATEPSSAAAKMRTTMPRFSGNLPLTCTKHPSEWMYASEATVSRLAPTAPVAFCRRRCLQPYTCHRKLHLCPDTCHPADSGHGGSRSSSSTFAAHTECRYKCGDLLPCGHPCKLSCGLICDCLQQCKKQLPCFHEVLVGVDPATGEEVRRRVGHMYDGPCVKQNDPCEVDVPRVCRFCGGRMTLPCHVVAEATEKARLEREEAQGSAITDEGKDKATADTEEAAASNSSASQPKIKADGEPSKQPPHRTEEEDAPQDPLESLLECDSCRALRQSLRTEIRVELLKEAGAQKLSRKREVEGQLHEQQKAASRGMFEKGQRVSVKSIAGLRGRHELLFPAVDAQPLGNRWCDAPMEELLGDHGRIVDRHVDFVDTNEVLYLVGLNRGGHTVVADSGLELLRAVITTTSGFGNGPGAEDEAPLLITGPQAPNHSTDEAPAAEDEAQRTDEALAVEFPLGAMVHCVAPVEVLDDENSSKSAAGDGDGASDDELATVSTKSNGAPHLVSDVCATVTKVEHGHVLLSMIRTVHRFDHSHHHEEEEEEEDFADEDDANDGAESSTSRSMASQPPPPKAHRAEAGGGAAARDTPPPILVEETVLRLRARPDVLEILLRPGAAGLAREPHRHVNAIAERRLFRLPPTCQRPFLPVPLAPQEAVSILAVVNYPLVEPGVHPTFVKSRGPCYVVTPARDAKEVHGGRIALVPVVFVDTDAEATAERELAAELRRELERRIQQRFDDEVDARYIRNMELAQSRQTVALNMYRRQVKMNGGVAPEKWEKWPSPSSDTAASIDGRRGREGVALRSAEVRQMLRSEFVLRQIADGPPAEHAGKAHRHAASTFNRTRALRDALEAFNDAVVLGERADQELLRALQTNAAGTIQAMR